MKRLSVLVIVSAVAMFLSGCMLYFGGYAQVSGTVYVTDGDSPNPSLSPGGGALITFTPSTTGLPTSATAGLDGSWAMPSVRLDRYTVRVTKQGYTDFQMTYDVSKRNFAFSLDPVYLYPKADD